MASHHTAMSARACARDRSSSAQASTSFSSTSGVAGSRRALPKPSIAHSPRVRVASLLNAAARGGLEPAAGQWESSREAWELLQSLPRTLSSALSGGGSGPPEVPVSQEARGLLQHAAAWMASPGAAQAADPVAAARAAISVASSEALAGVLSSPFVSIHPPIHPSNHLFIHSSIHYFLSPPPASPIACVRPRWQPPPLLLLPLPAYSLCLRAAPPTPLQQPTRQHRCPSPPYYRQYQHSGPPCPEL